MFGAQAYTHKMNRLVRGFDLIMPYPLAGFLTRASCHPDIHCWSQVSPEIW